MAKHLEPSDVKLVWSTWAKTRPRPRLCKFTVDRKKLIEARLRLGYEPADLVAVIRYVNESNDPWPQWMRGNNPRKRSYLDLDNLFRVAPLGKRVEEALLWLEGLGDGPDGPDASNPCGTDLGPLARFGRG